MIRFTLTITSTITESNNYFRLEIIGKELSGNKTFKAEVLVPEKKNKLPEPSHFRAVDYSTSTNVTYVLEWQVPDPVRKNIESINLYFCKHDQGATRCQVR